MQNNIKARLRTKTPNAWELMETANEAADYITTLEAKIKDWEENLKYLLDQNPSSVRSCYKHGAENLMESMCITFLGMRSEIAKLKSK